MQRIPAKDQVDVLIVGAGAAGSVVAAKAADAGKQVLLLEAGPERKLSDLTSSQIWARKLKWGGTQVEEEGNLKIGHNFNAGYGTGGSALHHYAVWPRLH
ncbi:MAG: FAD-binding protein, partial [Pseudomonadales bacterium]